MTNKKNNPILSIVTVCYNEEDDIEKTCRSIQSQVFKNFEWIVIDGGSTDKTLCILNKYKDNITKIISEKDDGVYDAMNKGISFAKGEYVLFLNGGDYLVDYLSLQFVFDNNICTGDVLYGDVLYLYRDGHKEKSNFPNKIKRNYFAKNCIGHQASFINKKLFYRFGFYNKDLKIVGDWEKWIVFKKNKVSFVKIPNIVAVQKRYDGLSTAKNERIWNLHQKETMSVLKKYYPFYFFKIFISKLLIKLANNVLSTKIAKVMFKKTSKARFYLYKIFELLKNLYGNLDFYFKRVFLKKVSNNGRETEIIVSLTSFPERMAIIHRCLLSILSQDFKPDRLILWLSIEEFPLMEKDLPKKVISLKKKGLEIMFCNNIKSYKKLIPSLKKFPDAIIVTADDDIFYSKTWLRSLYFSYKKNPKAIHCHRANKIIIKNNKLEKYVTWPSVNNFGNEFASFNNLLNGCGGVLYPPRCFYRDIFKEEIFTEICKSGDDIWFWGMAVLNNVKINVVENNISIVNDLLPDKKNGTHLWNENSLGGNDLQIENLLRLYPELKRIIIKENHIKNIIL